MLAEKPPETESTKGNKFQDLKGKAKTPDTAESPFIGDSEDSIYDQVHSSFTGTPCARKNKASQEEISQKPIPEICPSFKKSQKCNFFIVIQFCSEKEQTIQFRKPIENWKEENEKCSLIFERQYQKKKIKIDSHYKVRIQIVDQDQFSKEICQMNFCLSDNSKKSNGKLSQESFNIFYEIQNYNTPFIKMLAFSMNTQDIENFYSYKHALISRSPLLNQITSLKELQGITKTLSQQNMGSRILQKLIQKSTEEQRNLLISELKTNFSQLVYDKYGNYVIQKLFLWSSQGERNMHIKLLENDFISILKTKTGTHTLQVIASSLNIEGLQQIYTIIKDHEIQLCLDEFGNHFIQKLLEICLNYDMITKIFQDFVKVATDKHGIMVLKKLYKLTSLDYFVRVSMLSCCENSFKSICDTQYGHYVIEELFSYYYQAQLQKILNICECSIIQLSLSVFSSSIIKKSLQFYGQHFLKKLITNLNLNDGIKELMQSNSGSFVLHRLLQRAEGTQLQLLLLENMRKLYEDLKKYDKKMKWKNFLQQ